MGSSPQERRESDTEATEHTASSVCFPKLRPFLPALDSSLPHFLESDPGQETLRGPPLEG